MIFSHSRGGLLKIGPEALAIMQSYEQHARGSLEAGGFLLGRYLRRGYDLVVDEVTVPQPDDVRSRFGFERNAGHQRFVDEAWNRTGGTCCWLGDWHTHAEPVPTPSRVDMNNWRMQVSSARNGEAIFFVIVGQLEIAAWEGVAETQEILPMSRKKAA